MAIPRTVDPPTPKIRNADGTLSDQYPLVKSTNVKAKSNTVRAPDAQGNKFKQGMTDVHRDENNNPITTEDFPNGLMQTPVGLHFYPHDRMARFHVDALAAKAANLRSRNLEGQSEAGEDSSESGIPMMQSFVPHLPQGSGDDESKTTGGIQLDLSSLTSKPHSENINLLDPSTKQHSDYLISTLNKLKDPGRSQETSDSRETGALLDDGADDYEGISIPPEKQDRPKTYAPVSRADATAKLTAALRDATTLKQKASDTGYVKW